MKRIGTHDSATGESPLWWCALLTPFARTQRKAIYQQYFVGCRLFDIRIKKVRGVWRCAHGWWFTRRTAWDILWELNTLAEYGYGTVSVMLTFEGRTSHAVDALNFLYQARRDFPFLRFGPLCAKYGSDAKGLKVAYETLAQGDEGWIDAPSEQCFLPLDGRNWQTFLPIPWLWKQFHFRRVKFNDKVYRIVDFL